jgi:hypothetical protein
MMRPALVFPGGLVAAVCLLPKLSVHAKSPISESGLRKSKQAKDDVQTMHS